GAICRWAIEHRIDRPDAFKDFDRDGYQYCKEASEPLRWVFRRKLDASSDKA
ncbi:MAG: peroxide stress protein YaaA, partial [Betaproteobacteria bacterium]|nr:peroxide stress protein YaaA [Betaproteobacteria bacterium]